jgi:hypothetical protein
MAELPEKRDYVAGSDQDIQSGEEMTDMYHAVIKETKEDFKTEGKDVGDMFRMGKEQQFKVRQLRCNLPPLYDVNCY